MDFRAFSNLIIVRQTLYTLPFAYVGVLFAGGAGPQTWIWVTIAVVSARTAGMTFNQVIDADIDAENPRTCARLIPRGEIRPGVAWGIAFAGVAFLILSSWMLNPLCFYLSFPAAIVLFAYSYSKRFSAGSHFFLGLVEAAAPIGGYLAVTGEFSLLPFLLGASIMIWIAGFDIVYAIQDMDFDRKAGLHSIPAKLGKERALLISAVCYLLSLCAMVTAGLLAGLSFFYLAAVAGVTCIFIRQQMLARQESVAPALRTIFQINAYVAPLLFLGTLADVLLP